MHIALAIKSCHKYHARRAAQQETWLKDWEHDFYYLLGNPTPANGGPVLTDVLSCDVSDAFADIAPKVQYACKYALEQNTDFLVIADDDTYLRPERLLISGFEKHDYMGFMRTSGLAYNADIPYAQGSCYTLSARAMEFIATSPVMQPGIIDDGAVGQALFGKVPFTHQHLFQPGPDAVEITSRNSLISTHKALPDTMRRLHYPWGKSAL